MVRSFHRIVRSFHKKVRSLPLDLSQCGQSVPLTKSKIKKYCMFCYSVVTLADVRLNMKNARRVFLLEKAEFRLIFNTSWIN